jgi:hypothetical protein
MWRQIARVWRRVRLQKAQAAYSIRARTALVNRDNVSDRLNAMPRAISIEFAFLE